MPKLGVETFQAGRDNDASELNEASETPDMASNIDADHQRLAEMFDLDEGQAQAVDKYIKAKEHDAARSMQAKVLGTILGRFLGSNTHDAKVVFWSLAFQTGVARQLTRHNPNSKAKELGVTRALMSRWQKIWEDDFAIIDLTYAKTDEARVKYREARLAYCRKQKGAAA